MVVKLKKIFQEHYRAFKSSIKQLSYDRDNDVSLCNSNKRFINFDAVVKKIAQSNSEDSLCSPDVIHFKGKKVIFVEFKNGRINDKTKMELKLKGIEGGFIGLYKAVKTFDDSFTFDNILSIPKEYYIVYNSTKNLQPRVGGITQHLESATVRFGLEKYQGTFFEKVRTVSEDVFEQTILEQLG